MVLFIKDSIPEINIDLLCKMMLNIENNKNLYNINGAVNNNNISNRPFNYYTHNRVDYEINVSFGVVLFYTSDESINYPNIDKLLCESFKKLPNDMSKKAPVKIGSYNSTCYTLLSKAPDASVANITSSSSHGSSFRKIINTLYDVRKCCESGSKFVWLIQIVNRKYLQVSELNSIPQTNEHLSRSISTIIYDKLNLFNVSNGQKQLDYPSLNQYNMFKNNQILSEHICISNIFGLDYEIIKCYKPNITQEFIYNVYACYSYVDYNDIEIRRVNPEKKWSVQIVEPFDYKEQESLENDIEENGNHVFRNDICFITQAPLYKNVYVLKVAALINTNTCEIDDNTISHVLITPYILHITFVVGDKKHSFESYLKTKNIMLLHVYMTNFPRSEIDAISLIPDKSISLLKRNIMSAISVSGACYRKDMYSIGSEVLYTADVNNNTIIIGCDNLYDFDIIKYRNTNTILFQVINL